MSTPRALCAHWRIDTALGPLLLARTARGLCGVWFEGQRHAPSADCFAPPLAAPDDALLRHAGQQLLAYFAGQAPHFDVPLDLSAGTPFQQSVWRQLLSLAHGQLGSYGAIARALGQAQAARAVGAAVGRNPISILVPCHRVLGRNGQLTGYAGGLWRKQALLRLEGHTLF